MSIFLYILLGLVAAVLVLAAYVRLAPVNAAAWHERDLPRGPAGEAKAEGSYTVLRDVVDARVALQQMDLIIAATPRTRRVAGSVEQGKVTYVTRTAAIGFPDYTTVEAQIADGTATDCIALFGRLRFGRSDLGVNRARIKAWLTAFDEVQR